MVIRDMALADLMPADYNPRQALQRGDAEYEKLKRSIEQFGYVEPIIWNETTGVVVGGHQRLQVLRDMGVASVECVVVKLDRAHEMALNVALNKISGAWDEEKLQAVFADLEAAHYDVSLTGFEAVEIEDLFRDASREAMRQDDFDSQAAADEPAIVQPGDLWMLGEHRLFVGAFNKNFDFLMNGTKANLLLTYIPSGCAFDMGAICDALDDGASVYVFHDEIDSLRIRQGFKSVDFHQSFCCIWKREAKGSKNPYLVDHVPVLYGWKNKGSHEWYSDRKQTSMWEIPDPLGSTHEIPVPVLGYAVLNSTMKNSVVLDPCAGFGASIVTSEMLGRICYAAVDDVNKASAAVKRYVDLAGGSERVSVLRNGLTYKYSEVV